MIFAVWDVNSGWDDEGSEQLEKTSLSLSFSIPFILFLFSLSIPVVSFSFSFSVTFSFSISISVFLLVISSSIFCTGTELQRTGYLNLVILEVRFDKVEGNVLFLWFMWLTFLEILLVCIVSVWLSFWQSRVEVKPVELSVSWFWSFLMFFASCVK